MNASSQQGWTPDAFFATAEAQEERGGSDGHGPVPMAGGTLVPDGPGVAAPAAAIGGEVGFGT